MVGKLILQCFGGLQMYDIIYRDIRLAGSTGDADRQTNNVQTLQSATELYLQ